MGVSVSDLMICILQADNSSVVIDLHAEAKDAYRIIHFRLVPTVPSMPLRTETKIVIVVTPHNCEL